jgi:hypothetical protein
MAAHAVKMSKNCAPQRQMTINAFCSPLGELSGGGAMMLSFDEATAMAFSASPFNELTQVVLPVRPSSVDMA